MGRTIPFATPFPVSPPASLWAPSTRATVYAPGAERDIDSISFALTSVQAAGAFRHHLVAGMEYYTEDLNLLSLRVPAANSPPINVFNPIYGLGTTPTGTLVPTLTTQALTSYLVTVQDRIEIGRFNLVAGVQYIDQDFLYGVVGTLPNREKHFSPKFGVTYALSKTQSVYVSTVPTVHPIRFPRPPTSPCQCAARVSWRLDGRPTYSAVVCKPTWPFSAWITPTCSRLTTAPSDASPLTAKADPRASRLPPPVASPITCH